MPTHRPAPHAAVEFALTQAGARATYLVRRKLARLLASGDLMGIAWRATIWIPMFQFEKVALTVRPGTRKVLAELDVQRDDWGFATNPWLQNRRPADLLVSEFDDVLAAARIDRWIHEG